MTREDFIVAFDAVSKMSREEFFKEAVPRMVKMLDDDYLQKLEFALWVECQERFVAVGDQEPIDKYENIRGE